MKTDSRDPYLWFLDGHTPVQTNDVFEWFAFIEKGIEARRVALDDIEFPGSDPVRISTVFVGVEIGARRAGRPMLFESMVMGGPLDERIRRYATWDEAQRGHDILKTEVMIEAHVFANDVRRKIQEVANGQSTDGGN